MGLVRFDRDADHVVAGQYSDAKGPVLRSQHCELARVFFAAAAGAEFHQHPEEQLFYCVQGRLAVVLGEERYEIGPGEASFHPSSLQHRVRALEDTVLMSFKVREQPPVYEETGRLV